MNTTQTPKPTTDQFRRIARLRRLRDEAKSWTQEQARQRRLDALLDKLMDAGIDPSELTP